MQSTRHTPAPISPEVQRCIDNFTRYQTAFITTRHPNLWASFYAGYSVVDVKAIRQGLIDKAEEIGGVYDILSSQPGLLREINYRMIDIADCLPKAPDEKAYYLDQIRTAVERKTELNNSWSVGGSTYRLIFKHDDGEFKGWINQLDPETDSGDVWLIISPTKAVFYLRD